MKSKIVYLLLLVLMFATTVYGQDITGRWEGEFQTDYGRVPRRFIIRLEVVQVDKMLYGAFSNRAEGDKEPAVLYSFSGEADKKDSSLYRLIKEKVEETTLPDGLANVFLEFRLQYKLQDSTHILFGKWFPDGGRAPHNDGSAGVVFMRRIDMNVSPFLHEWMIVRKGMKQRGMQ
jgi:hypothetical protein